MGISPKKSLKIATRGSDLALYQAHAVQNCLQKAFPGVQIEIEIIKTKGDKILDVSLSKIGDKGLFTKEIEDALLDNSADIAVHSLKDLPTSLPHGLMLAGVLPRHDPRDVLVHRQGKKLSEMGPEEVIATSSLRRKAQILNLQPNRKVIDIRGNVNTRLRKLEEGYCDALIMASAGLLRLGFDDKISEYLAPETILPAVSQGIIAIEIREGDAETKSFIDAINHPQSMLEGLAERAFLRTLEGGCQVPVGIHTITNGTKMFLTGFAASLDGKTMIKEQIQTTASQAVEDAIKLAKSIYNQGGKEILNTIRNA